MVGIWEKNILIDYGYNLQAKIQQAKCLYNWNTIFKPNVQHFKFEEY